MHLHSGLIINVLCQRFTEAVQAAAANDTCRALPADDAAHTATDIAVLAAITEAADAGLDAVGRGWSRSCVLAGRAGAFDGTTGSCKRLRVQPPKPSEHACWRRQAVLSWRQHAVAAQLPRRQDMAAPPARQATGARGAGAGCSTDPCTRGDLNLNTWELSPVKYHVLDHLFVGPPSVKSGKERQHERGEQLGRPGCHRPRRLCVSRAW